MELHGVELRWLTRAVKPRGHFMDAYVGVQTERVLQYRTQVPGNKEPYVWTKWRDVPEVCDVK